MPDEPVVEGPAQRLDELIEAELDRRFPLINGLERGEYEAVAAAAAAAIEPLVRGQADALQAATDERDELQADRDRQTAWNRQDDWLRDQHARYHDVPGNMFGRDECGELRCSFWDAAVWVLNAPKPNAAEHIPCPPEDNCRVCRGVAALGVGVPDEPWPKRVDPQALAAWDFVAELQDEGEDLLAGRLAVLLSCAAAVTAERPGPVTSVDPLKETQK